MRPDESVTCWIEKIKSGDSLSAQKLWERYYQQLVERARRELKGAPRRVADEEDVALSVFHSLCNGAQQGRYTQLTDRSNLWPLLIAITRHKAVDLIRYQNRKKRGGGGGEDVETPRVENDLSAIIADDPTPEFALQLAEQLESLLSHLDATGDEDLRRIAVWKMEGYSVREIAAEMDCVPRTVQRKLQLIAKIWESESSS